MNPHLWGSTAMAAVLEIMLETRKSLQRMRGEITTETCKVHLLEHLEESLKTISTEIEREEDKE